ncbi:MAG TPA: aminoglycoside phosphotransferase family protein [Candidatus Limnocylindrales bacterium]|nr:aminoglycoside phosphotransferase family protein [Candidatus Limnocylindrales bacterium]
MSDRRLDLRLIVPGPGGDTLLVAPGGRVPGQEIVGDEDEAAIVAVTAFLHEAWSFRTPVLETHPRWEGVADDDPIPVLVTTETAAAGWTPPDGLAFAPIPATAEGVPDVLAPRAAELLEELRTGAEPPALRPRWARRGWHVRASRWMTDALAAAGRPLLGEPEPFYLRGISALLRGTTAEGDVFLKAVFPPFHAEPVASRLLAERFPSRVARVVAIEPDEGWLIVDDVAASWVGDLPSEGRRAGLVVGAHAVVAIQASLAGDLDPFVAAGCPVRPIGDLAAALDAALGPGGVVRSEVRVPVHRRERAVAATREAVARVATLGLPSTIVHGDFHPGNVGLVDERAVIIDWSDAAVSNPAVDLVTWLAWSRKEPEERKIAIDAWSAAWAATGSVEAAAVRAARDAILVVGAAYQVVSYDGILRALEPATRYTMAGGANSFLEELEAHAPG